MSVVLSIFTPDIAYRVDGCPDPTIERAVLNACIEFCEFSGVLKRTLDDETVAAGTAEVDLPIDNSEQLVSIQYVACNGSFLQPVAEADASEAVLFGGSSGQPLVFVETALGTIRLYPVPDKSCTLSMKVSVKPSRTANYVDALLFTRWKDPIVDGALARLYSMPERWGSGTLASFHLNRFFQQAAGARIESSKGNTRAQRRVYGPRF